MRMNVYLTTGKKNYKYAYVAIRSLFERNRNSEIYLYIVSEDLEDSDLYYENELARQYGHHIVILRFDEEAASRYIKYGANDHWAIGAMSSYWIFHELLPREVDRIIVIESDTVVVGDFSEIYATDFEGAYAICPGPEHKPKSHREFMKKIGGECLTFVLSMYDVERIRKDFTLDDILNTDARIKELAGNSMMELTFGLLFAGKIKYIPARTACIDENERYMEELGYDYVLECEKTAKIIHFSSYSDYSKPWNPVFLVPGYREWWKYAVNSPYFKEYIEGQWRLYDKVRQEKSDIMKNISYRNILLCALAILYILLNAGSVVMENTYIVNIAITLLFILSIAGSVAIRRITILIQRKRHQTP